MAKKTHDKSKTLLGALIVGGVSVGASILLYNGTITSKMRFYSNNELALISGAITSIAYVLARFVRFI